jgi:hypothetical protein
MDCRLCFEDAINRLKAEERYRIFANDPALSRHRSLFRRTAGHRDPEGHVAARRTHILDSKAADFDQSSFQDRHEDAVVEMIAQSGRACPSRRRDR